HAAINKLRSNEKLSAADLKELETLLETSGVASPEDIEKAQAETQGLGLFIRSLVGMDREVAKKAFGGFLAGKSLSANQIEFVDLIIDHLTEHGFMDEGHLYESPFTDIAPQGPDAIFSAEQIAALMTILRDVRMTATAA